MYCLSRPLFLTILFLSIAPALLRAQHIYETEEIRLIAESTYDHPIMDIVVNCLFVGEQGDTIHQEAFWDGGQTYRIRFSPPYSGEWSWSTSATNKDDHGLNGRRGTFEAVKKTGNGNFDREGWLIPSPDGHYLTYESGLPYFWLAGTAWEITWKSNLPQVQAYLDDRKQKGFTAIQLVIFSHQRVEEFGVRNRNGEPSITIDSDLSRLNPEYFRYLDSLVHMINDHDMVAVMAPMWAALSDLYQPSLHRFFYDRRTALMLARYVGARYAGDNVIWIMGGDDIYDTDEKRQLFTDFANTLNEAGNPDQLETIHPHGWGTSYMYYPNDAPASQWVDFNMYHSSHTAYGDFTWKAGWEGYWLEPAKPLVNAEPNFEDIYHNFWATTDTANFGDTVFRIRPSMVREASYESILGGGLVGISYGANGVWQWTIPEMPGSHLPRQYVEDAWRMPGSGHMSILKSIMQEIEWYRLVPRRDLIESQQTDHNLIVQTAENDRVIIAYFPVNTRSVTFFRKGLPAHPCITFINPTTGARGPCTEYDFRDSSLYLRLVPPDSSDWIMIVDKTFTPEDGDTSATVIPQQRLAVKPNPIVSHGLLIVEADTKGTISIDLFSLQGENVLSTIKNDTYSITLPIHNLPSGAYYCRATIMSENGPVVLYRQFVVLGAD